MQYIRKPMKINNNGQVFLVVKVLFIVLVLGLQY